MLSVAFCFFCLVDLVGGVWRLLLVLYGFVLFTFVVVLLPVLSLVCLRFVYSSLDLLCLGTCWFLVGCVG